MARNRKEWTAAAEVGAEAGAKAGAGMIYQGRKEEMVEGWKPPRLARRPGHNGTGDRLEGKVERQKMFEGRSRGIKRKKGRKEGRKEGRKDNRGKGRIEKC
jgi:hypothetical protein